LDYLSLIGDMDSDTIIGNSFSYTKIIPSPSNTLSSLMMLELNQVEGEANPTSPIPELWGLDLQSYQEELVEIKI